MDDPVNDSVTDEPLAPEREQALADLRRVFDGSDLEWSEVSPTSLMVTLPGERKQQTPCRFDVGRHALEVHAFVCRQPDENFEGVYRWLLERNMKMYAVAFDRVLNEPGLHQALSAGAEAHAQQFGWDRTADQMVEVYAAAQEKMRADLSGIAL